MQGQSNRFAKKRAIELRRTMTDVERLLWRRLRYEQLGVRFRRQHPFEGFILDFVCLEHRLVVEVDGSQHFEDPSDLGRTMRLELAGFQVLRFWNNEVLNEMDAVLAVIFSMLDPSPPQPSP